MQQCRGSLSLQNVAVASAWVRHSIAISSRCASYPVSAAFTWSVASSQGWFYGREHAVVKTGLLSNEECCKKRAVACFFEKYETEPFVGKKYSIFVNLGAASTFGYLRHMRHRLLFSTAAVQPSWVPQSLLNTVILGRGERRECRPGLCNVGADGTSSRKRLASEVCYPKQIDYQ